MPPHRRRPAPSASQAPPIRRPKVAGLRNRPEQREPDQHTDESPDTSAEKRANGVLTGIRGVPPRRPADTEPDAEDATTVLPRVTEPEIDPETNEPPAVVDPDETEAESDTETDAEPETEAEPDEEPRKKKTPARVSTRPAGKRRATGTARPSDLKAAESGVSAAKKKSARHADERPTRTPAQKQLSLAIALAVVAVLLTGAAVFFRGKATDLTSGDTNKALTDSAATSQLTGQLKNAIRQTFSYNYTDLASTEKAVKEVLADKALCQYNKLFGQVKELAPQQKIILDSTVRDLGVVRMDGDRAEALIYIDQVSTRVDTGKSVAVSGQFGLQARRDGGQWKIIAFDMFGQRLPDGTEVPTC